MSEPPDPHGWAYARDIDPSKCDRVAVAECGLAPAEADDPVTYLHLIGEDGSDRLYALPPAALLGLAAMIGNALSHLPVRPEAQAQVIHEAVRALRAQMSDPRARATVTHRVAAYLEFLAVCSDN